MRKSTELVVVLAILALFILTMIFEPQPQTAFYDWKGKTELRDKAEELLSVSKTQLDYVNKTLDWQNKYLTWYSSGFCERTPIKYIGLITSNKCGRCGEYTALFAHMMGYANITAHIIVDMENDHAWNRVLINGSWYKISPRTKKILDIT